MKIVDVVQGSKEWHKVRELRISASHAQAIQANGKGLDTYVKEKLCKFFSSADDEGYSNKAMAHGIEQEPVAAMVYEFEKNVACEVVGYVIHNEFVGCSPDRLVGGDGLVEIKCPSDKVYFQYLLDGKIDPKYFYQMQMQMMICEREWCDYVVYNPNFKKQIKIARVFPDIKAVEKINKGMESGFEAMREGLVSAGKILG